MKFEESAIQCGIISACRTIIPGAEMIFHIPNGGKRNARAAARFKREGVMPGVFDLFLPVARGEYHGLFLEVKSANGKPSAAQRGFYLYGAARGYSMHYVHGIRRGMDIIIEYLKLR